MTTVGKGSALAKSHSHEVMNPEKFAQALLELTNPHAIKASKIAVDCGMHRTAALALGRKLEKSYRPLAAHIKDVKTAELKALTASGAKAALEAFMAKADDGSLMDESPKNLAIAAAVLIDKRQLLSGEPTVILLREDRKHLEELAHEITMEMSKRHLTMETDSASGTTRVLDDVVFWEQKKVKTSTADVLAAREDG